MPDTDQSDEETEVRGRLFQQQRETAVSWCGGSEGVVRDVTRRAHTSVQSAAVSASQLQPQFRLSSAHSDFMTNEGDSNE